LGPTTLLIGVLSASGAELCPTLRLQTRAAPAPGFVCQEVSEGLALCAACGERLLREAEIEWNNIEPEAVFAELGVRSAATLSTERPARQAIVDMPGTAYWVSQVGDGFDAAGLLHPKHLSEVAGTTPVIGMPAVGTFLMWIPGDAETDTVMAVGVRRIFEEARHPVSDKVYRWHNGAWVVWGEVVESGG
jgi:hypothetical protein